MTNYQQAMEQAIDSTIDTQTKLSNQNTKKSKSQRKREGRKRAVHKELMRQLELERKILRNEGTLPNLDTLLFKSPNKLEGLNILGNLLLLQAWLINELRYLTNNTKVLVATASTNPPTCFSITEGQFLCGHALDEVINGKQFITPDGKALASEFLAPTILSVDLWHDGDQLNHFYQKCTTLMDHENEEISTVGKSVCNKISSHWFKARLNLFWSKILSILSNMKYNNADLEAKIEDKIFNKGLSNVMAAWLIENKIFAATQKLLPNLIDILLDILDLKEYYDDLLYQDANFSDIEYAADIDEEIKEIIAKYERFEEVYQELYQTILSQLHDQGSAYTQVFMVPTTSTMLKNLDVPLLQFQCCDRDKKPHDFISDLVASKKKNKQSQSSPTVIKKTRSRRKNQKKNSAEKQELIKQPNRSENKKTTSKDKSLITEFVQIQQESTQLPNYAQRVLKWFDPFYIAEELPDATSILYHTYSPLADLIIKKYGAMQLQPNQTNSDLIDSAYYMPGQIKHNNGDTETVVFCICFGDDGFCYHRGYSKVSEADLSPEIAKSKHRYDFPDLLAEIFTEKKKIRASNDICKDTEYTETATYVEIGDSVNEVTITLFKPV